MLFNTTPRAKNTRRRVYLITNDDNPAGGSAAARQRALTRGQDLKDAHVWLEPFFFAPPPPATFDLSGGSFWRELVGDVRQSYRGTRPDAEVTAGGAVQAGLLNPEDTSERWVTTSVCVVEGELLHRVTRRAQRKRVLGQMQIQLGNGQSISGCLVSMIRAYSKPVTQKLEASTNEPLRSATTRICHVHAAVLQPEDLWRGYNFGGQWVFFEPWELKELGKEDGEVGMILLGFKDRERLKLYHNMKPAAFYQPTETMAGSSVALEALVDSVHAKGKVAICRYRRSISEVRLVALLPQRRVVDPATGMLTMPCGFFVVQLPFAEDLRELKLEAPLLESDLSPQQLEASRSLVQALRLPEGKETIATVPNPVVHKHFSYLQAVATAEKDVKATVDCTRPEALSNGSYLVAARAQLDYFREAFELSDEPPTSGSSAKRPKVEKTETPTTLADWITLWQQGKLGSQTVPVLKACCKDHGLAVGGKKDDVIARVHDFLDERSREDAALR